MGAGKEISRRIAKDELHPGMHHDGIRIVPVRPSSAEQNNPYSHPISKVFLGVSAK
jgi:hypothetical protein